jgi:hypothetical protein
MDTTTEAGSLASIEASMAFSLADLIREGAAETPQCIGDWYGNDESTCALSAALRAAKARRLL